MRYLRLLTLIVFLPLSLTAETVFTRDGKVHRGKIIEETVAGMNFRTYAGQNLFFPAGFVMRSVYGESYLGKQVIKKTSGEELEVFVVAEDRNSYTIRFVLESPDEFSVVKKDVMFITRKDPTGLAGKAGDTWVDLTWNPPYGTTREYRVYYRKFIEQRAWGQKEEEWKRAGSPTFSLFRVRGLASKKKYQFMVTAIDRSGYESQPSNELLIMTANRPPDDPAKGLAARTVKGKLMDVRLSWHKAKDPDGEVRGYSIFQLTEFQPKKVAQTPETSFTVPGLDATRLYRFRITATDSDGNESKPGLYLDTRYRHSMEVLMTGSFAMPIIDFARVLGPGGAFSVTYLFNDVGLYNLRLGLTTGIVLFSPVNSNATLGYGIPVMGQFAWTFYIADIMYLAPRVSAGVMITGLEYTQAYLDTFVTPPAKNGAAAYVAAGIELGFDLHQRHVLVVVAEYGILFERNFMHSFTVGAGYGVRFR